MILKNAINSSAMEEIINMGICGIVRHQFKTFTINLLQEVTTLLKVLGRNGKTGGASS